MRVFEALGCSVEPAAPQFDLQRVWLAMMCLRSWQQGALLHAFYDDPAKRALLKDEAIYEIENGLKQTAFDISAASIGFAPAANAKLKNAIAVSPAPDTS